MYPSYRTFLALGGILLMQASGYAQGPLFGYDPSGDLLLEASEGTGPPVILGQPQTQVVQPGNSASFSVVVADTAGVTYQWQFSGTNIPGVTGDALLITNVSSGNEGPYSVVLSNPSGSITSSVAQLYIDSRGVGMPDSWQLAYFGNLTNNPTGDYDGDGVCNLDEFLEGTDPTNPNSYNPRLHVLSLGSGVACPIPTLPYYSLGQVVTLNAVPDPWSSFLGWTGAATGTKPQISLLMNGHKYVTASFGEQMPPPAFQSISVSNTRIALTWSAYPGRAYQLQFPTNLNQSAWVNLGGGVTAVDVSITANDSITNGTQRFYQVYILP